MSGGFRKNRLAKASERVLADETSVEPDDEAANPLGAGVLDLCDEDVGGGIRDVDAGDEAARVRGECAGECRRVRRPGDPPLRAACYGML